MDNQLVANYLQTEHSGVDSMTDNRPRKRQVLPISLSEAQLAAIDTAAKELGMNRSEYIRHIFMQTIADFPDDLAAHGSGLNKSKEL